MGAAADKRILAIGHSGYVPAQSLPPLGILITSYVPPNGALRLEAERLTVATWKTHLHYLGDKHVHVADDGSEFAQSTEGWWQNLVEPWASFSYSRQEREGVGASLNTGLKALENYPIIFYAQDDWALTAGYDLSPWAELLLENEEIGCVRLGQSSPFLRGGEMRQYKQGWGIVFEKYAYIWCMRPALYHRRFFDAYGPFPERQTALEVDRIYMHENMAQPGPDVLLALAHPWQHLWSIELGDLEPGQPLLPERYQDEVSLYDKTVPQ